MISCVYEMNIFQEVPLDDQRPDAKVEVHVFT